MPTVNTFPVSQPSRSLLWFIEYAGLDVQNHTVDVLSGAHKAPVYTAKFPAGLVPTYEDGQFYLEESIAILKLLAEGHEVTVGTRQREAKVNMMLARHQGVVRQLTTAFFKPWLLSHIGPEAERAGNAQAMQDAKGLVGDILQKYDELLGKSAYIAGDELSLADFMFVPEVDQLSFMAPVVGDMLAPHTNLTAYLARMKGLRGYPAGWEPVAGALRAKGVVQ